MINNLQEFYNHITNPLDDDYTIQKLIDAYQQEEYIEEKKDEHQRMYEYFLQRRNNRSGFAERDINFEIPASIFSIENIYKDKDMIPYASYLNYSLRQPFFRCSPNFISNDKDFTKMYNPNNNYNHWLTKDKWLTKSYVFSLCFSSDKYRYIANRLFLDKIHEKQQDSEFLVHTSYCSRYTSFEIYVDEENLLDCYRVLHEVLEENKDIKETAIHPFLGAGIIDDVIGIRYAPFDHYYESSSIFDKSVYQAIRNSYRTLLRKQPNLDIVNDKGEKESLINAIVSKIIATKREDKLSKSSSQLSNLSNRQLKDLRKTLTNNISNLLTQGGNIILPIDVPIKTRFSRNDDSILFTDKEIRKGIKSLLPNVIQSHPAFLDIIKQNVRNQYSKSNYDSEKLCLPKDFLTIQKEKKPAENSDKKVKPTHQKSQGASKDNNPGYQNSFFNSYPIGIPGPVYQPQPMPQPILLLEDKSLTPADSSSSPDFYHYTKEEIIQDLAINSREEQFFQSIGMSDDEITASQEKINSVKVKTYKRH